MINSDAFGAITALDDAERVAQDQQEDAFDVSSDAGNVLWSYHNENRLNGVPVADEDRGLKIDDEGMLGSVFVLCRTLRSMMLYLSPDGGEGVDRYNDLLDKINDGRAEIIDEIRQWDQDNSRFVLWVRYNDLEYRLHPRFSYLREE